MAKTEKKKTRNKIPLRGFVFTGDPKTDGTDPASINIYGYVFELNGKPVKVAAEAANKFAANTHFTEHGN